MHPCPRDSSTNLQMWQTIGHDWAVALFTRAAQTGRVAHTYLLTGPEGIGKRHLARQMAAMLHCRAPQPPCGRCAACSRVASDAHPDVSMVSPEDGHLKIAQIRAVQHDLSLSPYEGRWRVAIVTDFQTATVEAANALLKTLEEPPSRAVIILTATDASLLLPTVVSRCQVLPMRAVARDEIQRALMERWQVAEERAALVARVAGGRVGWAIRAAEDAAVLDERAKRLDLLQEILGQGRAARIMAAERLAKDDEGLEDLLRLWQTWWRDVLLVASGCEGLASNVDYGEVLAAQAAACDMRAAALAARRIDEALQQLEQNAQPRLVLEVLFLGWPTLRPARA